MKKAGVIAIVVALLVGVGTAKIYYEYISPSISLGQEAIDIIDSDDIELVRDTNGDYTFIFKEAGKWDIFVSENPNDFSDNTPIKSTSDSKVSIKGLDSQTRYYFKAVNKDKGETIISERKINLRGSDNTRDLGGYTTVDGKTVKWGKLYRSAALDELTESDRVLYDKLDISTIVDFREADRHEEEPDNVPSNIQIVSAPIMPGGFDMMQVYEMLETNDIEAAHELFVNNKRGDLVDFNDSFKTFFDFVENNNDAILYHCAGGRDRTGFASFLLLHALGVDKETIVGDYMDTNKWRVEQVEGKIKQAEEKNWSRDLILLMNICTREKIEEMYSLIQEEYGTVDYYLIHVLDVDIAKLRDMYLQ